MKAKQNEATRNRPEGARTIDDSFVKIDLREFTTQVKDENAWRHGDRNAITVFKTDSVTIVLSAMHKGAAMIKQSTGDLMQVHVEQGRLKFEANGSSVVLEEGEMALLHKGYSYDIEALEDSVFLLTLYSEHNSGL